MHFPSSTARRLVPVLSLLLLPWPAGSATPDSGAREAPRLIVNLLDYIATDYPGAVSNGRVVSKVEYDEQLEFVAAAMEAAEGLPKLRAAGGARARIAVLQKLVQEKRPAADVAEAARAARAVVISATGMEIAPAVWPRLENGRALYALNCVTCHGAGGRGDGPAAARLEPRPTSFFDAKMASISPFQAFNTIRTGVPGTGMPAWSHLTDQEAWDLAFFVMSLRHEPLKSSPAGSPMPLEKLASASDDELIKELGGTDEEKARALAAMRTRSGGDGGGGGGGQSLATALGLLKTARDGVLVRDYRAAKAAALRAYLEGVEPAEPRLRASDPEMVVELEERMAAIRSAIDAKANPEDLGTLFASAEQTLGRAQTLLANDKLSPWVSFLAALGIILREGFEAALIIVALLAVVRASSTPAASRWIHAGWTAAVAVGVAAWFFSGWLMRLSGASRELLEGCVALSAVAVLLYVGFWLHSRTEIHRWKAFIDGQVSEALARKNLLGLAAISFAGVFREAFETVLFLRAVTLEAEGPARAAAGAGAASGFLLVAAASVALVRYSAKLPIRRVFSASSTLIVLLAVMIAGKGVHSLQETGLLSITTALSGFRFELLGIYPTRETLLGQLLVLALSVVLWHLGNRPPPPRRSAISSGRPSETTAQVGG